MTGRRDLNDAASMWSTCPSPEQEGDDDRIFARLNREEDGSLSNNDGVRLTPAGTTAMGNCAYRIEYGNVTAGSIVLREESGEIVALHHIEIDKTRRGIGIDNRVVKAILASADGDVRIIDIENGRERQEDAREFWKDMGIRWVDYTNDAAQMDGLLSWSDYGNARMLIPARRRSGTGAVDSATQKGERSQGQTTETGGGIQTEAPQVEGIEVGEISDEEADKYEFPRSSIVGDPGH